MRDKAAVLLEWIGTAVARVSRPGACELVCWTLARKTRQGLEETAGDGVIVRVISLS